VQKRLQTARAEMARASDRSLFDHTLVNDDLDKCYQRLKDVLGLTPRPDDADGLPGERHNAGLTPALSSADSSPLCRPDQQPLQPVSSCGVSKASVSCAAFDQADFPVAGCFLELVRAASALSYKH
jgi:hypothetical protein